MSKIAKKRLHYLQPREIAKLWQTYQNTFSIHQAAHEAQIVYGTAYLWIKDISNALAGEKITRQKGRDALISALRMIERMKQPVEQEVEQEVKQEERPVVTIVNEDSFQRVDRLWNELQLALGDLAQHLAETKTAGIIEKSKKLEEEAKKSNITGFLRNRWNLH